MIVEGTIGSCRDAMVGLGGHAHTHTLGLLPTRRQCDLLFLVRCYRARVRLSCAANNAIGSCRCCGHGAEKGVQEKRRHAPATAVAKDSTDDRPMAKKKMVASRPFEIM
ncbi:hypothetical protein TW95_gp1764 [Pandoravirus inopinatum]|uniref:Uncharacterized protein n=1 Tax=Pandoravirus inopinatum TaxID=1605721 RepID=A0A0B5IZV4_9VIRU|nr:hypothetical protein TW95_gp1764 [Pandoravirus inopinatum]AJF98498.1 hypothetical protein [Pandoravirus inopinatum]